MYSLKEIHDISYDFLKELQAIVRENNIDVYLDSGTLLGAVREKDFIPWDDDVDLVIKRSDYNKLVKIIDGKLSSKYEFIPTSAYNGLFFDFAARFIYKDGTLRDVTPEDAAYDNMQNRIAFDLFILDNCPDNEFLHKIQVIKTKMYYGMAMAHRYNVDMSKYSGSDKIKVSVLTKLGKLYKLDTIIKKFNRNALRYDNVESGRYWAPTYILKEVHYTYRKEWYDGFSEFPIRDTMFKCPKDAVSVLTTMYGPDYMTPPPEAERISLHI